MAVPDKVPEELAGLLRRMVAIPASARPSLREVHAELLCLHGTYSAAGHAARYLRTVWGIPSHAPPSYTDNTLAGVRTTQDPVHRFSPPAAASHAAVSAASPVCCPLPSRECAQAASCTTQTACTWQYARIFPLFSGLAAICREIDRVLASLSAKITSQLSASGV